MLQFTFLLQSPFHSGIIVLPASRGSCQFYHQCGALCNVHKDIAVVARAEFAFNLNNVYLGCLFRHSARCRRAVWRRRVLTTAITAVVVAALRAISPPSADCKVFLFVFLHLTLRFVSPTESPLLPLGCLGRSLRQWCTAPSSSASRFIFFFWHAQNFESPRSLPSSPPPPADMRL